MANKIYNYTTPAEYTYDSDKIEVADGIASLKENLTNVYARYHLNSIDTGDSVEDTSGNSREGLAINSPSVVAGKLNNCFQFDGINQYINCGDIANFERTDSFSIEGFFKTNSATNQTIISRIASSSPYQGWKVDLSLSGIITVYFISSGSNLIKVQVLGTNYSDNSWHHIIMTYDGSSSASGLHIYMDNVDKVLTIVTDSLTATIQNSSICSIGSMNGGIYHFTGLIDEALIYDKELTPTEVAYKYNSGTGRETEKIYSDLPTIEPTDLLAPAIVTTWDSFLETLGGGNEGSIGYNLYKVDKVNKYYWNGSAWVTGGSSSNYNSVATINTNIESFDVSPDKIGFIAYLISDGEQEVELDENQITYSINLEPIINAGSNKSCKDHETLAIFSDCSFSDPTSGGSVDHIYYKVDGEVDVWTEILQGSYGTLLEAIQAFTYQFENIGTLVCRLQAEDNEGAKSDDSLEVEVSKYIVTFNIKDLQGIHLSAISFNPGDGSGYIIKNSPFTYEYNYSVSEYYIIIDKSGYGIETQNISSTDHIENFTLLALLTPIDIYNYFTTNNREDIFKADVSALATETLVKKVLGLSQENYRIFSPIYDTNHNLLTATIKIYPTKTDCDDDTNSITTYAMTATYNGENEMSTYKVVEN